MNADAIERSKDGSIKVLWTLDGRRRVESVLYRHLGKAHVCVSTQSGCNVGCPFCETGRHRNLGNLTADEILGQVTMTVDKLPDEVDNGAVGVVVVAGMGEPLLNFEALRDAAIRLLDDGLTERVTVTTSGVVPKIQRLAEIPISRLTVSVHATTDALRDRLVPLNRKWPLKQMLAAACRYQQESGTPLTANYLLLDGVNDSDEDAERLCELLDADVFTVKLKQWNLVVGTGLKSSPPLRFAEIAERLRGRGFEVLIDASNGTDIGAGCGQLAGRRDSSWA